MKTDSTNSLEDIWNKVDETAGFLAPKLPYKPKIGIILGSGLGGFGASLHADFSIDYSDIPHFPVSTVAGHAGKLSLSKVGDTPICTFQGRFHFYEGYHMSEVVMPVRVMKALGVEILIVSNACGGVNPDFEIGDVMFIEDHINLFPVNPLLGPNNDEKGPRFPDMSEPYDKSLLAEAEKIAKELNLKYRRGTYAGLTGPTLETPAEYRYVQIIGADAVGMSTVPEVIAARHLGMRCFGISVITDLGVAGKIQKTTHEDVMRVASSQEPIISNLLTELLKSLA